MKRSFEITIITLLVTACGVFGNGMATDEVTSDDSTSGAPSSSTSTTSTSSTSAGPSLGTSSTDSTGSETVDSSGSSTGMLSTSTGQGTTGGWGELPCEPQIKAVDGIDRCLCDGNAIDPIYCGCVVTAMGCECDGKIVDPVSCAWPCGYLVNNKCECDGLTAPESFCECHPWIWMMECVCNTDVLDPGECGCQIYGHNNECYCDGQQYPIEVCL